jgi:UDP-3-O-[3-hydroxymyristoyl] glucosamine N-acyltransferase|tara:strand:+ start:14779 stop:15372 length:594 start_codon:yes stop_codon:yes gene_type:complete
MIKNEKPLKIIGYSESMLTQDSMYYGKNFVNEDISIMTPDEFKNLQSKDDFQYFIGFALDLKEREQTIDLLDEYDSDCVTFIHETASVHEGAVIGKGSCVANFSTVMQGAVLGKHCFVETYCLISHNTTVGNNCMLHSGTMIAGKTTIGKNCMFNFRSGVMNKLDICDNTVIGAFSNVTKNIDNPGVYVGTPARKLR